MEMYQETGSTVQQQKEYTALFNTGKDINLCFRNMNIPHFETRESSPVRSNTLLTHIILINNCFKKKCHNPTNQQCVAVCYVKEKWSDLALIYAFIDASFWIYTH
jgi:hypothetical protein